MMAYSLHLARNALVGSERGQSSSQLLSLQILLMVDRFSTPPRRIRAMAAPSPVTMPEEMTVDMVSALTGARLGQQKVTRSTRLLDVRPALVGAMGGSYRLNEVHLINAAGSMYSKALGLPFADAVGGETFRVVMVDLEDMVYLDFEDRRKEW